MTRGWAVERFKFNETTLIWEYDGFTVFNSDKELLDYLKAQSKVGIRYMHRITSLLGESDRQLPPQTARRGPRDE